MDIHIDYSTATAAREDILRGNMVVEMAGIDLAVGVVRMFLCLHFETE